MDTRLILTLLGAGILAFACSSRPRSSESGGVASLQALQLTNKVEVPSRRRGEAKSNAKPDARIASRLNVNIAANEVRFAFNVTNIGKKHVELSFPNGKSYDIVVVDSLGREVWHWSTGRMFTQGVQNKQLGTGDIMRVSETWKRPTQHGHYTAIVTLNSSNYPIEERADFTLP
jgi:hypothetical protein